MDERIPETQPSGALVPPPGKPPGALATSAPLPPREPRPARLSGVRGISIAGRDLRALVDAALDELDQLGDRIAGAAGLR
jgi:hypothetical protein